MGRLYFELEDIDLDTSINLFMLNLFKYYQSRKNDNEVYKNIREFDLTKLNPKQLSVYRLLAERRFNGEKLRDLAWIPDNGVYRQEDLIGNLE